MASGGNEPVADGGGGEHSIFADALLRGLREMDKDEFSGRELFDDYIIKPVGGRSDQLPQYSPLRNSGHAGGDFIFARKKLAATMTAEDYGKQGDEYADRKMCREAQEAYGHANAIGPNNGWYLYKLSAAIRESVKYGQAAQKAFISQIDLFIEWMAARMGIDKWAELDQRCKEAITTSPNSLFVRKLYAGRLSGVDQEKAYKSIIDFSPNDAASHYDLADSYKTQKRVTEAEVEYKIAIKLNPEFVEAHLDLAEIYKDQKRNREAEIEYKAAIRLDPNYSLAHYNLGLVLFNQEKYAEAEAVPRQALRIPPTDQSYKDLLPIVLDTGKR